MLIGSELAAFGVIIKQMLEDVQQRLIFKAQVGSNSVPATFMKLVTLCYICSALHQE